MRIGRANGKIILFGEHFVVHGEPAVAVPVRKYLRVFISRSLEDTIEPEGWNNGKTMRAVERAKELVGIRTGLHLRIFSDFPPGAGMGASGAFSVALGRALNVEDVLSFAHELEKIYHGNPSGIDTAVAYYGSSILFRRGEGIELLPRAGGFILAVYSGDRTRSVKELVASVGRMKEREPERFEAILRGYRTVISNGVRAMKEGDLEGIGRCMDVNQNLLRQIGVSSDRIEEAIKFLKNNGALGAKLTGGGDGGFVIGLFGSKSKVEEAVKKAEKRYRYVVVTEI